MVETPTTAAPETTVTPVAPAEKLQFTAAPVAGVAYKLGMTQANLNKNLYLSGEMDGYYFATTEDKEAAVDVYVELVEGGMKLYFNKDGVKNYLAIVLNGTYTNVVFNAEGSVFVYNAECNNLVTSVEGTEYYLGTYNNFKTFSASKTSYINAENTGVSQFPAGLVATETPVEPPVVEPTEPEVTEPEVTEPEATEPEVTEPEATEPEATEPEVTEPEVTEPEVTEPEATEPEATEPETTVAPETEAPVATTAPAGSDNDADETGDSSIIVIAVCMMMATAAVVVLVQKKRAF